MAAFVLGTTLGPSVVSAASSALQNVLVKNTATQPVPGVPGIPANAFYAFEGSKDQFAQVTLASSTVTGTRYAITNLIIRGNGTATYLTVGSPASGTDCSVLGDSIDLMVVSVPAASTVVVPLTQPLVTPAWTGNSCLVATLNAGTDITAIGYTLP